MDQIDPKFAAVLILLMSLIVGYTFYLKFSIRRLDRIIAEKEAALNAPDQPASTPTATPR
ncbi:MAG: hypothetical protein Q7T19_10805 [Caulobacter sp.]|nr:hypothetical protein [Caulobacter sp.]